MERKIDRYTISLGVLVAMYITGLVGLSFENTRTLFQELVVFHLVVSSLLVFSFHKKYNFSFYILSAIIFTAGFFLEVAGVATGNIFGSYYYGKVLGYKVFDVPLLIGLNWLMLVYAAGSFFYNFNIPTYLKVIFAAISLVVLDFFIEPAAVKLSFWEWNGPVPFQNYVAWLIISLLMLITLFSFSYFSENKLAKFYYPIQFLFFIGLYLLI